MLPTSLLSSPFHLRPAWKVAMCFLHLSLLDSCPFHWGHLS